MSERPTQGALDLHPSCFENQSANPRRSSHLVPQSDQVDLPPDLDWNRSLLTFGVGIRLCLVTNQPSSNVGRSCWEGGRRKRFGQFLALVVEEATHGRYWEDPGDGPTTPNAVVSRFTQLGYRLVQHEKDRA